jgi:hypothetical protein
MSKGNGDGIHFMPVQQRMMDLLSDGMPHSLQEMHGCLHDELGPISNIYMHVLMIRKRLRPIGEDLAYERIFGVGHYRHVRKVRSN